MRTRTSRLATALLATATVLLAARGTPARAADNRPNVVFILIDDFGWADLGCYGSTYHRSPNIDRLAQQGMRFTNAYAAAPVCSPTRAALLTGKYPARLRLTDWLPGRIDRPDQKMLRPNIRPALPLEELTLAEALKPAGYVSAHIGKWHLGGEKFSPPAQGFDLNVAGDHTGTPLSYFAPFRQQNPNRQQGAGRFMPGLEEAGPGEYLTDRLTTEAERFIESNKDKPFFLYLPHYTVHIPLRAKEELIAKYQNVKPDGPQSNPVYAAMIESMDESVGRIMRKLEELGLDQNTVVVFTSDNGGLSVVEGPRTPATSNAPLRAGKGFLYEGGIRVPLIVHWPARVKAGGVSDVPVSSIDFFPTLLAASGVESEQAVDGVNLLPVLEGSGTIGRDALYWHYPHYSNQGRQPGGAIRKGDWKLIEFYDNSRIELYNLAEDVGEAHDRAKEMPEKVKELHGALAAWRQSVGAQMMEKNPAYDPDWKPGPQPAKQKPVVQGADGTILLHARDADVHGTTVRYEPEPNKNTIGYWTKADDWVSWDFEVKRPGAFRVVILQGCGKGSGGSEVEFAVGDQSVSVTVQDTGHFQNFVERNIGTVKLDEPGRYTLTVKPKSKPGVAVMDLRQVTLTPADEE